MITARKATSRDATRMAKLLMKKYSFADEKRALDAFREERKYQFYRIAKQNNRIAGCISWRPHGRSDHGVAELTRIVVDPKINNIDMVKEMLFDQCVAEAEYYYQEHGSHLRKFFSLIHIDDHEIKEFFLRKGMHPEATLHSHFHTGKDELVLSLFFA